MNIVAIARASLNRRKRDLPSTDGKVGFSVAGILRCPVSWCDGGETGKEDMPLSESVYENHRF